MALLPREERDPVLQRVNDQVSDALSRRLVLLIGHADRDAARAAAMKIVEALRDSGLVTIDSAGFGKDRLRQMGALYFPYRYGLLAEEDRQRLRHGREQEIATRALSQVYGVIGMADAGLLQRDPFLLLPAFFNGLPLPLSRLSLDDGLLSLRDGDTTWVFVAARTIGSPYALETQARLTAVLDPALEKEAREHPGLESLRLGAVFFAKAGAEQAMGETSRIGLASAVGVVLLIVLVFRALTPLWLSLLAVGVGIGIALSVSLAIFGELHVAALLFGVTLIGIAVDYSLQYFSEVFAPEPAAARQRLRRVMAGITLGAASVTIGYLCLLLAPFPGLHQIAVFSAVGLTASWLTVVLWFPLLDRTKHAGHGRLMLSLADKLWSFWHEPAARRARIALLVLAVALGVTGGLRWHADDDVRRMQSLSADLVGQQARIQRLIGSSAGSQFFLVQAPDHETALQREEALAERLRPMVAKGALMGFQAPAQYVPSIARQQENRALRRAHLGGPVLARQVERLGLKEPPAIPAKSAPFLTMAEASEPNGPLGFLSLLLLDGTGGGVIHIVTLDGVKRLDALAAVADGLPGVRFMDPAADFSALLGKYRSRAVVLLAVSLVLMAPLLLWRYGPRGGARVLMPAIFVVALTPALRALLGAPFTFFDAMALVLVLSIAVDYAVFIAETTRPRRAVTLLAVALAACTTLLSFGLLASSDTFAVHAFGATMLTGVLLAFLLAPTAASTRANP
jgi:predicted exporter